MIVWLASYPCSGNMLLPALLFSSMGLRSTSDEAGHAGLSDAGCGRIGLDEAGNDWNAYYGEAKGSDDVHLVRTHRPPRDDQPAICVVRDGREACIAYSSFHRRFTRPPYPSLQDLVLGADYYGSWSEHYRTWINRDDTLLVRYEDLVNPSEALVRQLAETVRYTGHIASCENPLGRLQVTDPGFFEEAGTEWTSVPEWTPVLNAVFFHLHGDAMVELGYADAETVSTAKKAIPEDCFALVDASSRLVGDRKQLERICTEKEEVIQDLKRTCDEREAALKELKDGNTHLARLAESSAAIQDRLMALEKQLLGGRPEPRQVATPDGHSPEALLLEVCKARQKVIEEQQAELNGLRRYSFSSRLMDMFRCHRYPKLGRLCHHGPIPMQKWGRPPAPDYKKTAVWPCIAIVTPSCGHAQFIGRTMDSVLDQAYPNLQYYVQDGASRDGTKDILEQYADRLTGWESVPDGGQSNALNRGFEKTRGEIMAWLNSDDLMLPGSLAYVGGYFREHPEVDVVYGHRILIDTKGREIGRWILPRHDDGILSWADYVPQETLFWRRGIWEKAGGGVDESFRFAMDWDLLLRFRKAGARMVCLPRFLAGFRVHEAQKSTMAITEVGMKEMARIRERELGRVPSPREIRGALKGFMLRHVWADVGWRVRRRLGMDGTVRRR